MTVGIQAIETIYNGYRFRSRLEARWAVFFDTLGVKYQYEVQGFELGSVGRYLPDFWLRDLNHWAEIKPSSCEIELDPKCQALAMRSGSPVIRLAGDPYLLEYAGSYYDSSGWTSRSSPCAFALDDCDQSALWMMHDESNIGILLSPAYVCNRNLEISHPKLINAYNAARQARFEYGEDGIRRPAVRAAIPPLPSTRTALLKLVRLENYDGSFGPALRWFFIDQARPGTELSMITSRRLTARSRAKMWSEALLQRTIVPGEKGIDVVRALMGSTTYAQVDCDAYGKQTIVSIVSGDN